MFGVVQDFFDAHLKDNIGVRTDPRSTRRHITQHGVEHSPGLPSMDWIHPHEHSVNRHKLLAHLVSDIVVIHRRLGINAACGQLFEDVVKAIVLGIGRSPSFAIAPPQNRNPVGPHIGHIASLS
jgi:hypothetical protein